MKVDPALMMKVRNIIKHASENFLDTVKMTEGEGHNTVFKLCDEDSRCVTIGEYLFMVIFEIHNNGLLVRRIKVRASTEDQGFLLFNLPEVLETVGLFGMDVKADYATMIHLKGTPSMDFLQEISDRS